MPRRLSRREVSSLSIDMVQWSNPSPVPSVSNKRRVRFEHEPDDTDVQQDAVVPVPPPTMPSSSSSSNVDEPAVVHTSPRKRQAVDVECVREPLVLNPRERDCEAFVPYSPPTAEDLLFFPSTGAVVLPSPVASPLVDARLCSVRIEVTSPRSTPHTPSAQPPQQQRRRRRPVPVQDSRSLVVPPQLRPVHSSSSSSAAAAPLSPDPSAVHRLEFDEVMVYARLIAHNLEHTLQTMRSGQVEPTFSYRVFQHDAEIVMGRFADELQHALHETWTEPMRPLPQSAPLDWCGTRLEGKLGADAAQLIEMLTTQLVVLWWHLGNCAHSLTALCTQEPYDLCCRLVVLCRELLAHVGTVVVQWRELPPELWYLIFRQLDAPEDRRALACTATAFADMHRAMITTVRLPRPVDGMVFAPRPYVASALRGVVSTPGLPSLRRIVATLPPAAGSRRRTDPALVEQYYACIAGWAAAASTADDDDQAPPVLELELHLGDGKSYSGVPDDFALLEPRIRPHTLTLVRNSRALSPGAAAGPCGLERLVDCSQVQTLRLIGGVRGCDLPQSDWPALRQVHTQVRGELALQALGLSVGLERMSTVWLWLHDKTGRDGELKSPMDTALLAWVRTAAGVEVDSPDDALVVMDALCEAQALVDVPFARPPALRVFYRDQDGRRRHACTPLDAAFDYHQAGAHLLAAQAEFTTLAPGDEDWWDSTFWPHLT